MTRTIVGKLFLLAMAASAAGALALAPLNQAVGLALGTGLALAIVARPFVGLIATALALPLGSLVAIGAGGLDLMPSDMLVAAVAAGWLCSLLARRERLLHFFWPLWPVALFLALVAFETTLEPDISLGLKEVLRWGELLVVALAAGNLIRDRREMAVLIGALIVAGLGEALLGWYQFFMRAGPSSFGLGPFLRAYGTFGQPNPYAGYLIMVWPLALGPVLSRVLLRSAAVGRFWAWAGLVAALIIGVAIGFSLSRGAWVGMVVSAILMVGLFRRRLFALLPLGVGFVGLFLLLFQLNLLPAMIGERIGESLAYFRIFDARTVEANATNWAVVERMASWQAAWAMFDANPIVGVGPGRFNDVYQDFAVGGWNQPLGHAHNFYLNTLAEMGALGLMAYLTLIAGWIWFGLRLVRRVEGDAFYVVAAAGALAALVAAAAHNVFDDLYVKGMNVHVGLLVGIMLALHRHSPAAGMRGRKWR